MARSRRSWLESKLAESWAVQRSRPKPIPVVRDVEAIDEHIVERKIRCESREKVQSI